MNGEEDKFITDISLRLKEHEDDKQKLNKYIFNLETEYLGATSGNIVKGWEQIFTSKSKILQQNMLSKRSKILSSERIFSQTDVASLKLLAENENNGNLF